MIWKTVKCETGKTMTEGVSLNNDGTLLQKQAIANIFHNYFSTIAEVIMGISRTGRISQLNNSYPSKNMFYHSIKFSYSSTHEIAMIIKPLKPKNSHGYDKVSVKILKWSTPLISFPMTYIL
jgi:hypothetical protein